MQITFMKTMMDYAEVNPHIFRGSLSHYCTGESMSRPMCTLQHLLDVVICNVGLLRHILKSGVRRHLTSAVFEMRRTDSSLSTPGENEETLLQMGIPYTQYCFGHTNIMRSHFHRTDLPNSPWTLFFMLRDKTLC